MVPAQRAAADQGDCRRRIAQHRQLQIGQRQTLYLFCRIPGDKINDFRAEGMDERRENNREQGHYRQRLARCRPCPPPVPFAQAKRHHHGRTEVDGGKKGHDHHIEAVGQAYARHGLFTEPADQKSTQHAHQQYAGVFQQNGDRKRADFTPVEDAIALAFFKPGRAFDGLA